MSRKQIVYIITTSFFILLLASKIARAEIATTRDWMGFFAVGAGHLKSNTVNTNSWVYTSSCTKTPGTTPKLANLTQPVCSITNINPAPAPGDYELRMYANDQETVDALIARSQPFGSTQASPPGAGVNCPAQSPYPRVVEGLISTPINYDKFGNPTGTCVIDPQKAPFRPYNIQGYADLYSLYYKQSKATTMPADPSGNINITTAAANTIYHYTNPSGASVVGLSYSFLNAAAVIFVDHDLTITGNITGPPSSGLVFVVGGNVAIDQFVTRIDAVIIASGTIYTATAGNGCSSSAVVAVPLVVNGSLISLDASKPIQFCRTLAAHTNETTAAEQINEQPKYLVLLRNLYADTVQKWSEIQ